MEYWRTWVCGVIPPALCGIRRNKINITGIYETVNGVARESFYGDMFVDNCFNFKWSSLSSQLHSQKQPTIWARWVWCNSGEWNRHRLSNRLSEFLASLTPFGCSTFSSEQQTGLSWSRLLCMSDGFVGRNDGWGCYWFCHAFQWNSGIVPWNKPPPIPPQSVPFYRTRSLMSSDVKWLLKLFYHRWIASLWCIL